MTRELKKSSFVALYTLVVTAAVIVFNLMVGKLPAKYPKHDLSSSKIPTLGDTTRDIPAQLDGDVIIHIVADPNSANERIPPFVELHKGLSPRISAGANGPVLHPDVLTLLDIEPGNLIVSCESTGKKTSISFDSIIQLDPVVYYQYEQIKETTFDGEGQVTDAIRYITSDMAATVYTLTGHDEATLTSAATDAMDKPGMNVTELDLFTRGVIPQDYSLLIINVPVRNISADEREMPIDCLENGGRTLLLVGRTRDTLANLTDFISRYGMDLKSGFVVDLAPQHFYSNNPFNIIPDHDSASSLLSGIDSSAAVLLVQPAGVTIQESLSEHVMIQPSPTTSDSAFLTDPLAQEKMQGVYVLRAITTETINEERGTFPMPTVITAPSMTDDSILSHFPSITNLTLFMNAAINGLPGVIPPFIPGKSLNITYSMVTSAGSWSVLFIVVIPVIFLAIGFVIWLKRRKPQNILAYIIRK